jgi:hypothetical protein
MPSPAKLPDQHANPILMQNSGMVLQKNSLEKLLGTNTRTQQTQQKAYNNFIYKTGVPIELIGLFAVFAVFVCCELCPGTRIDIWVLDGPQNATAAEAIGAHALCGK